MFAGIVQAAAHVVDIIEKKNFRTHVIELEPALLEGLQTGASVAHNGCCLTVTEIQGNKVSFDLMQETLRVTNLGDLQIGSEVNIERAARFGDEIGGHQMSGHILFTATVADVIKSDNNCQIWFEIPRAYTRFIFSKGYIAVDGISLTIGDVNDFSLDDGSQPAERSKPAKGSNPAKGSYFNVNLIPETLQRTNIGSRKIGDRINIEIDPQTQAIVETVERIIANKDKSS